MLQKVIFILLIAITAISCQFTETLYLNEDGSGTMSIEMDMSEMMGFGGDMKGDSTTVKMDTIISMKELLEEKKDSISRLSESDQNRLKKMENYNIRMIMDSETGTMLFNLYSDFESIEEINDIFRGLEQTSSLMPGLNANMGKGENDDSKDLIGVSYSFNNRIFIRDAYIKDKELHKQEVDSIKGSEAFMSTMRYRLKYTFPRKIIKSSIENAKFSLDGKTIEVEIGFVDYFKNPDLLDLEVELEN